MFSLQVLESPVVVEDRIRHLSERRSTLIQEQAWVTVNVRMPARAVELARIWAELSKVNIDLRLQFIKLRAASKIISGKR